MKRLKKKEPWFKPHTKSDWADNEIPQGKRTFKYRFFEILPGFLSYFMIILLIVLSVINPAVGSIYLLIIITITLVKAVGVAYRTVQGYNIVKKAEKIDWRARMKDLENPHEAYERHYDAEVDRLKLLDVARIRHNKKEQQKLEEYSFHIEDHLANLKMMAAEDGIYYSGGLKSSKFPDPKKVYHAVLLMAYNEGIETLGPSIEAVKKSTFPCERIIFVLGYEERGGEEMEKTAKELYKKYKNDFYEFLIVKHPDNLPNEIASNGYVKRSNEAAS